MLRTWLRRVGRCFRFAWAAARLAWQHGEAAKLTVALGAPSSTHFKIEVRFDQGRPVLVYDGYSGAAAREVIETARKSEQVLPWQAYRDGQAWDWGPR